MVGSVLEEQRVKNAAIVCAVLNQLVRISTALNKMLFNVHFITKGRSRNMTLLDLDVCLLIMVTSA